MTRADLVEALTVERFTPWRPPAPAEPARKPRRRALPVPVVLGPLAVIEARRRALVEEASALWHDDAVRALASDTAPRERTA